MNTGVLRSMLLLDEPNISGLRMGIGNYSKYFLLLSFIGALTWQFVTDMKFMGVVKNLILALVCMGFFYQFHTKAVDLSFQASEELLREVSPRNIFLRRWTEVKVRTTDNSNASFIEKMAVSNLNDFLGTALFVLSKVCILILKLIYTSVYHFTYIFAPVTAILTLASNSKSSLYGSITSSLWCILMPLVLVVFLALVGNSIQIPAMNGQLAITSMDQLIWIFGITVLMLLAPSFTFSLIKGSIASTADAVGVKMTGVGAKALVSLPIAFGLGKKIFGKGKKDKGNFKLPTNSPFPYLRKYSSDQTPNLNSNRSSTQNSVKEKGGFNFDRSNQNTVKLSEMKTSNQVQKPNGMVPNLVNKENINSKTTSSKIPVGSFHSEKHQNQVKNTVSPKINPYSQFAEKRSSPQASTINKNNIFKQDQLLKRTEVKSKFERLRPVKSEAIKRTIKPRERMHEV